MLYLATLMWSVSGPSTPHAAHTNVRMPGARGAVSFANVSLCTAGSMCATKPSRTLAINAAVSSGWFPDVPGEERRRAMVARQRRRVHEQGLRTGCALLVASELQEAAGLAARAHVPEHHGLLAVGVFIVLRVHAIVAGVNLFFCLLLVAVFVAVAVGPGLAVAVAVAVAVAGPGRQGRWRQGRRREWHTLLELLCWVNTATGGWLGWPSPAGTSAYESVM